MGNSHSSPYDTKKLDSMLVNLLNILFELKFQPGTPDYLFWFDNTTRITNMLGLVRTYNTVEIKSLTSEFIKWLEDVLTNKNYYNNICHKYIEYNSTAYKQFKLIEKELEIWIQDIQSIEMYTKGTEQNISVMQYN